MKLSKLFHVLTIVIGFLGIFALIGAWIVSWRWGTIFGMDETHLFKDATVLILIAIRIQIAAIHHMMLEKNGENF
jgi:hypothetical protein